MQRLNKIQLTGEQIFYITQTIRANANCKLLVFGVGFDSGYWATLNRRGESVFLEESADWKEYTERNYPNLEIHLAKYGTRLENWKNYQFSADELLLEIPDQIRMKNWDVVLVDAPNGCSRHSPGRMQSIYTALYLVRDNGHIFVHDCEREVESYYCKKYLDPSSISKKVIGENERVLIHYVVNKQGSE